MIRSIRKGTRPTRMQEALLLALGIDSVKTYNDYSISRAFGRTKRQAHMALVNLRKKGMV